MAVIDLVTQGSVLALNALQGLGEPQYSYRWDVVLPDIGKLKAPRAETISAPFENFEREAFYEGASNTYYPTIKEISTISITLFHDNKSNVINYVGAWKGLIRNPDGTYNYESVYKKNISYKLLDKMRKEVLTIRYIGCFPLATSNLDMQYDSSERSKVIQEFSTDGIQVLSPNSNILNAVKNKFVEFKNKLF